MKPTTDPSPEYKTLAFSPSTSAPHPTLIAHLRTLINSAYAVSEHGLFASHRLPDAAASQLVGAERTVLLLLVRSGGDDDDDNDDNDDNDDDTWNGQVTAIDGTQHSLRGWAIVGTISLERKDSKDSKDVAGGPHWILHLFAVSLERRGVGAGARLLAAAREFAGGPRATLVAQVVVEAGHVRYYERRGFVEVVASRRVLGAGTWTARESFSLTTMVLRGETAAGEEEEEEEEEEEGAGRGGV